jgi:uncharacterized membrane protein YphA (DoxX/SURF4 family)
LTPAVLRYGGGIVSLIEIASGVALVVGVRARSAALALLGVLSLYATLDMLRLGGLLNRSAAFDFSVYAILLLWIAIAGPGPIALGDGRSWSIAHRLACRAGWTSSRERQASQGLAPGQSNP